MAGAAAHVGLLPSTCVLAATEHHATLVVEHSDGSGHAGPVIRVCVAFTEDSITGQQLLARSGVHYGTDGSGRAVCQIDNEPAQYQSNCLTAGSPYWAMYVSRSGASWSYSNLGFTSQTFSDGDAEGFRYEGQSDYSAPPSPAGVCPPPATAAPIPAVTGTPATHSVSRATSRPTAIPPPSSASAASGALATPSAAATTSATPAASASAHAVVTGVRAPPSGPASLSAGAWVAVAVGGSLLVLLAIQVARGRRVRITGQPG
jgi:hypothetical protein